MFKKITFMLLGLMIIPMIGMSQFIYTIDSDPEGAEVYLNGVSQGITPCKVKFFWREVPDSGMVFWAKKTGYLPDRFAVTEKPGAFRIKQTMNLTKFVPHYDLDSASALVEFDRLLAEFPDGKVVGKLKTYGSTPVDLKWEGFTKLGSDPIVEKTYDVLGSTGFNTPAKVATRLFSTEKKVKRTSRFLLGARLIDFWVDAEQTISGSNAKMRMKVEWQVFDRTTNQVVLKRESEAEMTQRITSYNSENIMAEAYGEALYAFLAKDDLFQLVQSAGNSSLTDPLIADVEESDAPVSSIEKLTAPKFESSPDMIQYATNACVTISTDGGHGSGVLISTDGYVLTAAHVVQGTNRIRVVLPSGLELEPKVIVVDETYDIALLDLPGAGFKALPIGGGLKAGLGIEVITIGTPGDLELGQSISKGILSGKRKFDDIIYLQTDVAVSPGNSGGPLIDEAGNIIGIIQRKMIGNGIEGIGFALPIETVLKRVNLSVSE